MIYNKLDQVVLSQDSVLRLTNQWIATKYDALGRVIITGLWPSAGQSQSALQTIYNNAPDWAIWDSRDHTDTITGYKIVSYALPAQFLTINYYDDYINIPRLPPDFIVSGNSTMTRGLLTATKTLVLNTTYNSTLDMLCTAHYYDDLGRNVKTFQQHYLGGAPASPYNYDVISSNYNFTNQDTLVTRQHYIKNAGNTLAVPMVTVTNRYAYDHMSRKTQTFEKIGTGTNILLSQTDYNPIGQVMAKHLHGATGAAPFLQDISYKYNERGWLKRINDPALAPTTTRLFSEQLNYDSVRFAATPKFNGNITEQMFQAYNSPFPGQQHVVYAYDSMNRLNSGISTTTLNENVTYDNLGNITSLKRGTNNTAYGYIYNGNQLTSVSGITTSNYGYDANGNANHDGRNNADLTYNLLNLPQTITATTPTSINITYTYDANGQKLRKVSNGSSTDYIGGIQYTNGAIAFIQTEEGRAINSGGNYNYEYTLTDHLGNNRVTFDQTNGKVGEEDYYPFGLNMHRQLNAGNKYLYNKKELQDELGQYDYGARFYDPIVGRFTMIDRFAEKYAVISPYQYGANDPIRNLDIAGDSIIVTVNARSDKKLWDSFHTLEKTPLGKMFLDKYASSTTFDIYVTKSAENSRTVFNTFADIERRGDVNDGEIELKSTKNMNTFRGLQGHKVKPKHVSAVTAINGTEENKITKYDIAAAIFHEIIAHIEGETPDFNSDAEHQNYGTAYVPINGIYTDDSGFPNIIEGSLAWEISEELIQLKINDGNGTKQDKSDLKKMLEADKKRREESQHQNH